MKCDLTGTLSCFGDGTLLACPCGNDSPVEARAGCLDSNATGGALRGSGWTSLTSNSFLLRGSAMNDSSALYFQGSALIAPTPFGDGLKCTSGPFVRLGTKSNVLGSSLYPDRRRTDLGAWRRRLAWIASLPGALPQRCRLLHAFTFNYTNTVSVVWSL